MKKGNVRKGMDLLLMTCPYFPSISLGPVYFLKINTGEMEEEIETCL
jgi:hypothetical protein